MPIMQLFHQVQQVLVRALELEGLCNGLSVGSENGRPIRKGQGGREKENILIENMQSKRKTYLASFIHLLIENVR